MYLSLNWLKNFVDIPKSIKAEEIGRLLTNHTVEIEGVSRQADKYNNVVVGKILEIKKHPQADRLQLVKVDIGKGSPTGELEIVCGASNIEVGQLVPVALVGAVLPNGLEIKPAEIRGVKSNGMLCAEDELGLGEDHKGILILDKAKVGQNFSDYLKMDDVVLEVDNKSITHRSDLWSHYGMARDLAAILDSEFKPYKPDKKKLAKSKKASAKLGVTVLNHELCPRYMAVVMSGIKIEESPKWLKDKLVVAGMRPINNIVDITNFVMLELGQPLHAFDNSLVDKIVVRQAENGEEMETLDSAKRKLDKEMLVIADSRKPIAIAGVMGGLTSEISNTTTSIIIESANFNAVSVRKTSQKLGMRTEASMRFEKGLDPNLSELGLSRAVELIKEICRGSEVVSEVIDRKKFKINQGPVKLDSELVVQKIGQEIKKEKIKKILDNLGFAVQGSGDKFQVTIPTWRANDISIAEDIIEEIARIIGYNNIEPVMPSIEMGIPPVNEHQLERKIKEILALGAHLTETYNYSFVGEDLLRKFGYDLGFTIRLANPISQNHTMLRTSLAPLLFENIKTNQAKQEKICLFEIGGIFLNTPGDIVKNGKQGEKLPYQEKHLGIIMANDKKTDIFAELKSTLAYFLSEFNLTVRFDRGEIGPVWAEKNIFASVIAQGKIIGQIGKLDGKMARSAGIKKEVVLAEISLRDLNLLIDGGKTKLYQEFAKFPPVTRDLAFVLDEKILYNEIKAEIVSASELIKDVELFDVYSGDKLGAGKKSLAFHLTYQADRTLTSAEVDEIQEQLIKKLESKFGAQFRNF